MLWLPSCAKDVSRKGAKETIKLEFLCAFAPLPESLPDGILVHDVHQCAGVIDGSLRQLSVAEVEDVAGLAGCLIEAFDCATAELIARRQ